jgi:hypothetical protein
MLQINSKAPSRHRPRIGMDRAGKKWDAPGFTDWEWDAPICKIDTPRWWGSSSGLNGRSLGDGRVVWRARAVALLMRACVCALVYMEYCGGSGWPLPWSLLRSIIAAAYCSLMIRGSPSQRCVHNWERCRQQPADIFALRSCSLPLATTTRSRTNWCHYYDRY